MEPNPQSIPPALVAFVLTSGRRPEEALTRCLFSLADDGWLRIDADDSGMLAVRIRRPETPSTIPEFERLALERVAHKTGTLTHVPFSALTQLEGEDEAPWRRRFRAAVGAEAVRAGLASPGVSNVVVLAVAFVLAATEAIAITASRLVPLASAWNIGLAVFVVTTIIVKFLGRPRLTEHGRVAAEWWRRNGAAPGGAGAGDRRQSGACTPPHASEALAEPGSALLPAGYVWSSYGGGWRSVRIGSPNGPSRGRPRAVGMLCFCAAFPVIPLLVLGRSIGGETGRLLPYAPAAIAVAYSRATRHSEQVRPDLGTSRRPPLRPTGDADAAASISAGSGGSDSANVRRTHPSTAGIEADQQQDSRPIRSTTVHPYPNGRPPDCCGLYAGPPNYRPTEDW